MAAASDIFPFQVEFYRNPAYLDAWVSNDIDPNVALHDIDRALSVDPYAPDILYMKMWFLFKTGDLEGEKAVAEVLWRTEGCLDCWIRH